MKYHIYLTLTNALELLISILDFHKSILIAIFLQSKKPAVWNKNILFKTKCDVKNLRYPFWKLSIENFMTEFVFIQKICQDFGILLLFETETVLKSYILRKWRKHFILGRNYKGSEGSSVIYPSQRHWLSGWV